MNNQYLVHADDYNESQHISLIGFIMQSTVFDRFRINFNNLSATYI